MSKDELLKRLTAAKVRIIPTQHLTVKEITSMPKAKTATYTSDGFTFTAKDLKPTAKEIPAKVKTTAPKVTTHDAALLAEIEAMRKENALLKKQSTARIYFKVSPKGGVSVYGLGRFPVTLYSTQWEQVFNAVPALKTFIADHANELSTK